MLSLRLATWFVPRFVFKIYLFLLYVYGFCLHVFLCTTRVPGAHGGQKRAWDALGLELASALANNIEPSLLSLFFFYFFFFLLLIQGLFR